MDHGKPYPSRAVDLIGRLSSFTKAMKDAVSVDTELSAWLTCRMMRMQLSMVLPYSSVTRWVVYIDSAVGEPSTPVRGERSRPWPATEAAKAGASEGGNGSRSKPEQLFFVLNGRQRCAPAWGCLSCWVRHARCHHLAGISSTALRHTLGST